MDYTDPNEKNPSSSVFRFDSYPDPNGVNLYPFGQQNVQNLMFSSFMPFQQTSPPVPPPTVPSTFSFGCSNANLAGHFPHYTSKSDFPGSKPRFVLGKRKTDSPPLQPCKQHITEEKMAEYMSKLHISSETATLVLEPESLKNKRLYMCEEMRKLQTEPLIPASLLAKIQQPCTALVLWQPRSKVLPTLATGDDNSKNNEESSKNTDDDTVVESVDMDNNEFIGTMDLDS